MKVLVKNARASFMDIFTPKAVNDGDPKFSITAICSDETTVSYTLDGKKIAGDHADLQTICEKVLKDKFGKVPAKHSNWVYNKADGSTTREKYINEDGDYWAGFDDDTWYMSASKHANKCQNNKLKVLDQQKDEIEANSGKLFSGCYVNVLIDVYAGEHPKSGKYVTASLEGVQLKKKGDPLGISIIDAADEFDEEEFEEEESDDMLD